MDYEEQFAKRQAALQGIKPDANAVDGKDTQGMSEAAKGLLLQQQNEAVLADQLFGGIDESNAKVSLNDEKQYK